MVTDIRGTGNNDDVITMGGARDGQMLLGSKIKFNHA